MEEYNDDFKELVSYCSETFQGDAQDYLGERFIIGGGNPASNILFIGKEASAAKDNPFDDYNTLAHYQTLITESKTDSDIWVRIKEKEIKDNNNKVPKYWSNGRITQSKIRNFAMI